MKVAYKEGRGRGPLLFWLPITLKSGTIFAIAFGGTQSKVSEEGFGAQRLQVGDLGILGVCP
jgi:hypothetical protein